MLNSILYRYCILISISLILQRQSHTASETYKNLSQSKQNSKTVIVSDSHFVWMANGKLISHNTEFIHRSQITARTAFIEQIPIKMLFLMHLTLWRYLNRLLHWISIFSPVFQSTSAKAVHDAVSIFILPLPLSHILGKFPIGKTCREFNFYSKHSIFMIDFWLMSVIVE